MSQSQQTSSKQKAPVAKWGAACASCATAKARCIRSDDMAAKCDRCQRLLKECTAQVHRPRKKRQVKPSRTAQIEQRLNGLVNFLKASGDLSKSGLDPEELTNSLQATSSPFDPTPSDNNHNEWFIPDTYNCFAPPSCVCRPRGGEAPPPPASDQELLSIYRNELFPHHPFVVVAPHVTAETLNAERPFLMASIRMVASFRSLRSMRCQMYLLMKRIGEHMLIRSERSMDLLLGILVIATWYHHHCFMHAQLTNLIALATTLAAELEINRPTVVVERSRLMMAKSMITPERTNEERRAYAALWLLSSAVSIGIERLEPPRFTQYLSRCLTELETDCEYETDIKLVNICRLQHLTQRIALFYDDSGEMGEVSTLPTPDAPRATYISAFEMELNYIKDNLALNLQADATLIKAIEYATLRLYQPPKIDQTLGDAIDTFLHSQYPVTPSILDQLYKSRALLTSWFENWIIHPPTSSGITGTLQMIFAVSMLGRWAKLFPPRAPTPGPKTPMPEDPSEPEPDHTSTPPPGTGTTGPNSHVSPSVVSTSSPGSEPASEKDPYRMDSIREMLDEPKPPGATAILLRTLLDRHPGLGINIPKMLYTIQIRLQQLNQAVLDSCATERERKDRNVWGVSAAKILIVRVKLEQWADLVSEGSEALSLEDLATQDYIMGDVSGQLMYDGYQDVMGGFGFSGGGGGMAQGEVSWMADMMQSARSGMIGFGESGSGGDASSSGWFDGYLDWGGQGIGGVGEVSRQDLGQGANVMGS